MNQEIQEISDLLHARHNPFESIESRLTKADQLCGALDPYIVWEDIELLNQEIAYLKHRANKGFRTEINIDSIDSLINSLQLNRNLGYHRLRYTSKAPYFTEHDKVTEIKSIAEGKRSYYWRDRLEEISQKLFRVEDESLSLNDLDELRYVQLALSKNYYLNKKARCDDKLDALLNAVIDGISYKISTQYEAYAGARREEQPLQRCYSIKPARRGVLSRALNYVKKVAVTFGLISASVFLLSCASTKYISHVEREPVPIVRTIDYYTAQADSLSVDVEMPVEMQQEETSDTLGVDGDLEEKMLLPSTLLSLETDRNYAFVIEKESQTAYLYKRTTDKLWGIADEYSVSTGINPGDKQKSGDHRTPLGVFEVVEMCQSSDWVSPFDGTYAYGDYFLRLNCGSWNSVGNHNPDGKSPIGLHGTNKPDTLKIPDSMGCVRFSNDMLRSIVESGHVKIGTPVIITEKIEYAQTI